ncbi:pilus assembly protein TadG-related protein [Lapillicoccus jejuensis]|uniref:pilus assembly protein TadG-related protein n=1 Tax=Lapillicoccus jejuensis TaxID=402171 RepID=UPI001FE4B0DF|nr:pilus assembly protein TadG-related protein [Lapillicoccus jejuensis]
MRGVLGSVRRRLAGLRSRRRDGGQLSILVVGLMVVVLVVILGGMDATAAQLARTRLLDAADAAALDAADAIDEQQAYMQGIGTSVTVSDATVASAAAANLASTPRPQGVSSWRIGPGTGTPDGRTAVVVVQGDADLPFASGVLSFLGGSVTITVVGRARSDLR